MTQKLHDPACYDLATHFLGAACSEHLRSDLAQHIQDAVEILASQESVLRRQKDAMFAKRIEANSRWLRIKAIRARLAELDATQTDWKNEHDR
jgi:hypothetical protein